MINRQQLLALIALTLMWGINWPMMKFSLRELSPLYFRALTMSFGALFLYSWYRARGLRMLPQGPEWKSVVAIGTLMMRRATLTLPVETLTIWMMILTACCLWVIAFVSEPWPSWQFTAPMWASLAYGAFINYGFAQTLWASLARNLPPATSAMSIMAIPLIGTLSATVIVGEWPHWHDFVAIAFVMAAIAAVLLPPRSRGLPA